MSKRGSVVWQVIGFVMGLTGLAAALISIIWMLVGVIFHREVGGDIITLGPLGIIWCLLGGFIMSEAERKSKGEY